APPRGRRLNESLVQRPLHLLDAVRLDDVADLDVVIASDLHAALEPLAHLTHVLLEALQRLQAGGLVRRRVNDPAPPDHAHLRRALDGALRDVTARDRADPADLERVADHRPAEVDDLLARLQLAFQRGPHVVGQLVDDVVLADLDAAL